MTISRQDGFILELIFCFLQLEFATLLSYSTVLIIAVDRSYVNLFSALQKIFKDTVRHHMPHRPIYTSYTLYSRLLQYWKNIDTVYVSSWPCHNIQAWMLDYRNTHCFAPYYIQNLCTWSTYMYVVTCTVCVY